MKRIRVPLVVFVDLDPTPGAMHTKESAREVVEGVLTRMMPHYNPKVSADSRTIATEEGIS